MLFVFPFFCLTSRNYTWYNVYVKQEYIKLLKEYISLLERVNFEQSKSLFHYGIIARQKDIDEGIVLRERLRLLEK